MTQAERDLAAAGALLLGQGKRIDRISRAVTLIAVAGLVLVALLPTAILRGAVAPLALVVVLGLAQAFYALRVGFDARLFEALGSGMPAATLDRLDAALIGLGLLPQAKAGRALEPRLAGAMRLMRWQAACLIGQLSACVAVAVF